MSTSRTSRDKEPLLGVNVSWVEEAPPLRGSAGVSNIEEEHLSPPTEIELMRDG